MPVARSPLCFVLVPSGQKEDPGRGLIDFDAIYRQALAPGVEDAGLEPVRGDAEETGGIIHEPMFERLLLCEFAVADLTTAGGNVFYGLGVRHAARPGTTQPIVARHHRVSLELAPPGVLEYDLGRGNLFGAEEARALRGALAARLRSLRSLHHGGHHVDSPLFQLLGEWRPGTLSHEKTDVFRKHVREAREVGRRLEEATQRGREAGLPLLDALRHELGDRGSEHAGLIVGLYLAYRDLKAYGRMIDLYEAMPAPLRRHVLVREQLAFALNRRAGETGDTGDRDRAIQVLQDILATQGPSPETCGILGRIYKDRWKDAAKTQPLAAKAWLRRAADAYRQGFDADWRDPYPGINAVNLLEMLGDADSLSERDRLLPVVRFAALQRVRGREPDYWDHATLLELAVLAGDTSAAEHHAAEALAAARAGWELETTADQLAEVQAERRERGEEIAWLGPIVAALYGGAATAGGAADGPADRQDDRAGRV